MSKTSHPALNPLTISIVGVVILAVAAIALTQSIISDGDEDELVADRKTPTRVAKSTRKTSEPKREGYTGELRKSDGKTEEERDGGIEPGVVPPKEQRAKFMANVSLKARADLNIFYNT